MRVLVTARINISSPDTQAALHLAGGRKTARQRGLKQARCAAFLAQDARGDVALAQGEAL